MIRIEIGSKHNIDEVCECVSKIPCALSKRGHLMWMEDDSSIVYNLPTTVSLSQALADVLHVRNVSRISPITLCLNIRLMGQPELVVYPLDNACTATEDQISKFASQIFQIDEDNVAHVLREVILGSGLCFQAILLDGLANLIMARRLDVAKCVLKHLQWLSGRNGDSLVQTWMNNTINKASEVFECYNGGATIDLTS